MKKFYLVLAAMILPFLANDLYATPQTQKKGKAVATKTRTGKATAAKAGSKARGGQTTTRGPGNTSAKRKPSAGGRTSGAPSSPSSDAEMRELGQVVRGEAGLTKGLAAISRKLDALNSEVGAIGAISDEVNALMEKLNQIDASVNLTCGGGQGGNPPQGFDDPNAAFDDGGDFGDPNAQDDGSDYDDGSSYADDGGGY